MDNSLYRGYEAVGRPVAAVQDGRVAYLNRAARALCDRDYTGSAAAELLGEELAALSEGCADALLPGVSFLDHACTLQFLAGDPAFYVFALADDAAQELHLRSALVSISGTMRQSLGLILMALDAIDRSGISEKNTLYLSAAERSVFQLSSLAEHMSLSGDLSSPEPLIVTVHGDLGELVRSCAADSAAVFENKGVPLELSLPQRPVWAVYDRRKLELLVHILLANGLNWCGDGPVSLSLAEDSTHYQLTLSVQPAVPVGMDEMFDLFTGRNATEEGLSLYAAWQIARVHQGTLFLRSSGKKDSAGTQIVARLAKEIPEDFLNQPVISWGGLPPVLLEYAGQLESDFFHTLRRELKQKQN